MELTFLRYLLLFVEIEPTLLEFRHDFLFHGSLGFVKSQADTLRAVEKWRENYSLDE
jgi:hypothetical protein